MKYDSNGKPFTGYMVKFYDDNGKPNDKWKAGRYVEYINGREVKDLSTLSIVLSVAAVLLSVAALAYKGLV